ncbi:PREDICTED: testis-expressed sequence 264 protein isoform X2 [Chrysochloris asiatica]|uniref:Testis-expressed sequence 264 protein isoform X2 n=1 Tax=Chrysochloris asiatica TaxID=185453 RepID=A0A9B0U4Y8_CHRAS|nr:PREDICTED: testis-expressed sequence 264 protein isoform X2 [Chrysochloris asiatica]
MSDLLLLGLIGALTLLLLLTLLAFIGYSGLLAEVAVRAGSPPIRNITVAYKFHRGPYGKTGHLFTESCSISPKLRSIAVYYDNPHTERKLCAHPWLEIYQQDQIHFVCPLARQGDFYVPEVKETDRKSRAPMEALTDGTGADTSDSSSVSLEVGPSSRKTSAATLSPGTSSHGGWDDGDTRSEHSYSESGASGSSFEELDLEGDGPLGEPCLDPEEEHLGADKWPREPSTPEKGEE